MIPAVDRPTDRRSRRRQQRRPSYPVRTLHLIDIENLAGTARPDRHQVLALYSMYCLRVGMGAMDQVVVASSELTVRNAGYCWPGARCLARSGPDGPDRELLAVIEQEHVAERFSHVTIASGDGIFTPAAAGLAAAGCQVTVVSRREGLSKRLALTAASRLIYIDAPRAAATASVAWPGRWRASPYLQG
jgi:hypothetical protein